MKKIILASVLLALTNLLAAQIRLSEIAPTNTGQIQDEDGQLPDWIEIFNTSANPAPLGGYSLADGNTPGKWLLPNRTLPPGERLLIFASGKNRGAGTTQPGGVNHWETAISEGDDWQYLIATEAPPTDWASPDFLPGAGWETGPGGFGYGDGDDATAVPAGTLAVFLRKKFDVADTAQLLIGLLSADFDDGFAAYLNGIEIARSTNLPANAAWDTPATPDREAEMYGGGSALGYLFDKARLRQLLRPGENTLAVEVHNVEVSSTDMSARFWMHFGIASGQQFFGPNPPWFDTGNPGGGGGPLHTNFKIDFSEKIRLFDPLGGIADSLKVGFLQPGHTHFRTGDAGDWCLGVWPTPDWENPTDCFSKSYAPPPVALLPAGFYNGSQTMSLGGLGPIRVTLDGSIPTATNGFEFNLPFQISKTTTVRARSFAPGFQPSDVVTATIFIDEPTKLPVVSVALPPDDFTEVYDNYSRKGAVAVEYFDKKHDRQFVNDVAAWVVGNWSVSFPQKSLQFEADEDFGSRQGFDYQLFAPEKNIQHFDAFRIRNEDDDWTSARMRDRIVNHLAAPTHAAWAAFQNVTAFINGEYWGHFNMRERLDDKFVRDNFGADPDSVTMVKTHWGQPAYQAEYGRLEDFYKMTDFVGQNDLAVQANFDKLAAELDVENFTDYFATQIFVANTDWLQDYFNNVRLFKSNKPKMKWRFLLWDCSYSSGNGSGCADCDVLGSTRANPFGSLYGVMFNKMLENQQFRRYFINRFADLMNVHFTPAKAHVLIDASASELTPEIQRHHDRWGTGDLAHWQGAVQGLRDFYSQRPTHQREHVAQNFNLEKQVEVTLQANPPGAGHVKISTVTPEKLPWTGVYFHGNPVEITAIPASGFTFQNWSPSPFIVNPQAASFTADISENTVFQANFVGTSAANGLVISEINYNSDSTRSAGDWFEVMNVGPTALDIGGYKIRDKDGLAEFEVPLGVAVPAGGHLVFFENKNKFEAQHPTVLSKTGPLPFELSKSGDTIYIFDKFGTAVANAACDRENPWPCTPDGLGRTLERLDFLADPLKPEAWFEGCVGGSPGKAFAPCNENPIVSEINYRSSPDFDAGDWIELHNKSTAPLDLSGWHLRDADDANLFTIPAGVTLPAGGFRVFFEDAAKFAAKFPAVANKTGPLGYALSGNGDAIRLYDASGRLQLSVCFDDAEPWDEKADGMGYTLENKNFNGNINAANNWLSGCYGGSPGAAFDPNCPPVSAWEATGEAGFSVFPNPAREAFWVHLPENQSAATLRLRDVFGKIVFEKTFSGVETQVETGGLAVGVFWVDIAVGERRFLKKVVVVR